MASVSFNVFTVYKKEKLMAWHPSGVTGTRIIRVIGVNFSEFLIWRNYRENEIWFVLFEFELSGFTNGLVVSLCHLFIYIKPFQNLDGL